MVMVLFGSGYLFVFVFKRASCPTPDREPLQQSIMTFFHAEFSAEFLKSYIYSREPPLTLPPISHYPQVTRL